MEFKIESYRFISKRVRGHSDLINIPQALQIVCPASSLLHNGVTVVPQFWHAMMTLVLVPPVGSAFAFTLAAPPFSAEAHA
jgi:hypothetical protein